MKEAFIDWQPIGKTKLILGQVLAVVSQYLEQGYEMTLRQLFYQLVTKLIIENTEKEYKKLSRVLGLAREAGLVDWDFIVDRNREYARHSEFSGMPELLQVAKESFRLARWSNQDHYVEVVTEKDALSGVLQPICDHYHVGLLVDRGYGSKTAVYDMAVRFREQSRQGKTCILLYLGDHDPSGLDMPEDISRRFARYGADVQLVRLGLTLEQVQQYHLPPNPIKINDRRAEKYIERYGRESWELDALPPNVLTELLEGAILHYLDVDKYQSIIDRENQELKRLSDVIENWQAAGDEEQHEQREVVKEQ